jgi:hypothetical protein
LKTTLVGLLTLVCAAAFAQNANELNLVGEWRFALDPDNKGESEQWHLRALEDTIPLPGTTDLAGKGYPLRRDTMDYGVPLLESDWPSKPAPARADEAGHLVRDYYYVGKAWYQRTIDVPQEWKGKHIRLFLERVLWRSDVWVDDRLVGNADSLATPHWLELGNLEPGPHRLTVRIDNSLQCNIGIATHAVGPETQSQWNGIVGAIRLTAEEPVFVAQSRVFPGADRRSVRVEANVRNNTGAPWKGTLACRIEEESGDKLRGSQTAEVDCSGDAQIVSVTVPLDEAAKPWDEFSTVRYRAVVAVNDSAPIVSTFGFRQIEREGRHILINGRRAYLRGTLDCAVYPKTGHPPVTVDEWLRVLGTVKDYGFNHVRFHTWCPPEAAFEAADRLGIYLQPETALWVDSWTMNTSTKPQAPGRDPAVSDFIQREIRRISEAYGNHPSFAFFCIGNEFAVAESDWPQINKWIVDAKVHDPRHLFATATARKPGQDDDFSVIHAVENTPARGVLAPHTNWDFAEAAEKCPIPVVAHETGQHPVFPDYDSLLPKFSGPLKPLNYERLHAAFAKSGLSSQSEDFVRASARFQLVQYKAEHEAMLRTADSAGYQLLMLNDFTGQAEALVGVLDPFWESKGVISREEVLSWNSPTVPLARFDKYVWSNSEEFRAVLAIAHYGASDLNPTPPTWRLVAANGTVVAEGALPERRMPTGGVTPLGEIRVPLNGLADSSALSLIVRVGAAENTWNLWSYPQSVVEPPADLLVTRNLEDALAALNTGKPVLLIAHGIKGANATPSTFASVYWSASWWGGPISNLGILCDPAHPALRGFPNTGHSDWQWYELAEGATTFCFTDAPAGFRPIVQLVPDFHFNTLLGQLFEARVGEGRLLVCGYDLETALDTRPAARQFRNSLLEYMQSDAFQPAITFSQEQLHALLK